MPNKSLDQAIARVTQDGKNNNAIQDQSFSGAAFRATISQTGNMNFARQLQSSSANNTNLAEVFRSTITQDGVGNRANVYQGTQP
jgi:hypothetical protein